MPTIHQLTAALQQEISGARAVDMAATLARYNRIVGSSDYRAAAHMLRDELAGLGLDEVSLESFPIDGQIEYAGRTYAPAWEPREARLEVMEPDAYVIADYATTPMCLPSGCPPTPADGITAQVVDVGRGDQPAHYEGIDVDGKAVLATGATTQVYDLAVHQFGAVCVLTNNMYAWSERPDIQRTMLDSPDATHLARLYHDGKKRRSAPAFSISFRQADRLRQAMAAGPVVIRAFVDTEVGPGELLEVVGTIAGSDLAEEEVWVTAHLCHPKPGACDNGSGVALGVELFRTLASLIRRGEIPCPRRTLRLLLLPEVSGTLAYAHRYQDRLDKVHALINLDMVGASHAATGAYCRLVQSPWSRPTYLNALGTHLLEMVSRGGRSHIRQESVRNWLYAVAPYDKGSDHDVTLNCRYGIPSLFFFYWPHRYYHTDLDTPEKLDPLEFSRSGTVAAALALIAASMTVADARWILKLVHGEATHALSALLHRIEMQSDTDQTARLWAMQQMQQRTLASVLAALPDPERQELNHLLAHMQSDLAAMSDKLPDPKGNGVWREGASIKPRRMGLWPLNFGRLEKQCGDDSGPSKLKKNVVQFEDKAVQALNYVDGDRTVEEIAWMVSGEWGPFDYKDVFTFFQVLADAEIVKL